MSLVHRLGLGCTALLVFLVSLALYVLTLAPGLLWGGGDFATFQTLAYTGKVDITNGVFGHPLWIILAHPFTLLPIRDVAWRANFATAEFAAAALSFVFLSACYLTRSKVAALLGTGALAVSHTFWTYAVMPKVYSLDALLLAICSYLLLRWRDKEQDRYLYSFALLYGLSFLNHLVMVTPAAGFVAFIGIVLWPRRQSDAAWHALLLTCLLFALGLVPYLYLLHQGGTASSTGDVAIGFIDGLLYALAHPLAMLKGLGLGAALGLYQFPISALVGGIGLYHLWQRDRAASAFIALGMMGTLAFMLAALDPATGGVYVWNLHYYLQAYVIFALAIAVGSETLWTAWSQHSRINGRAAFVGLTLLFPALLYYVAPYVARPFLENAPGFRSLPGRDNLTYALSPWKQQETKARDMGEDILRSLPPRSVIFADYSLWSVVRYLQVVEKARPDVTLVELPGTEGQVALIDQYLSSPNLFLADTNHYYDMKSIEARFKVVPTGAVYRLVK